MLFFKYFFSLVFFSHALYHMLKIKNVYVLLMNKGEKNFTFSSKNTYMKVKAGVKSPIYLPFLQGGVLKIQTVADIMG